MSKWQWFGLFPIPLEEGGLYCCVQNLNVMFTRCEPTTGVPADQKIGTKWSKLTKIWDSDSIIVQKIIFNIKQ